MSEKSGGERRKGETERVAVVEQKDEKDDANGDARSDKDKLILSLSYRDGERLSEAYSA